MISDQHSSSTMEAAIPTEQPEQLNELSVGQHFVLAAGYAGGAACAVLANALNRRGSGSELAKGQASLQMATIATLAGSAALGHVFAGLDKRNR